MTVPVLPESAPFTPAQRAWLNGFFAGLLGLDAAVGSNGHVNGTGNGVAATATALAPVAAEAEEDFPWHDPALPLDERLQLAEGRPSERKLMAAMAQLDCGACGYLCKTYSEAIAKGEEKDLKRCTPGGTETARKLKELVAAKGVATTSGAAMTSVVSGNGPVTTTANGAAMTSVVTKPAFNRANPFSARLIGTLALNRAGSKKETRHIMIDLAGSGLVYKPGDALGVFPRTAPNWSRRSSARLAPARPSRPPLGLAPRVFPRPPSDDLVERLVECADRPRRGRPPDAAAGRRGRLDRHGRPPRRAPPASPRHGWRPISSCRCCRRSSPDSTRSRRRSERHPGEVHLTVGVVRYDKGDRLRKGVASTYLAERVQRARRSGVFVHPSHRFQLPDDGDTPMIMVGPGTGIAPFRAFLEERHAAGRRARTGSSSATRAARPISSTRTS